MTDVQETLEILTFSFLVNVQNMHLILDCFTIVDRCLLQLVFEEYMSLSGNETEYESNFHVYFGMIVLSKNLKQILRASPFVKRSVHL